MLKGTVIGRKGSAAVVRVYYPAEGGARAWTVRVPASMPLPALGMFVVFQEDAKGGPTLLQVFKP